MYSMPDVKVYIRVEDLDKWNSIEKKSEWLHNALDSDNLIEYTDTPKGVVAPQLKQDVFIPKPPDPETGYPCCTKARPCSHWVFDGADELWTNTITGKTREVA